jgi:hypothetical protein
MSIPRRMQNKASGKIDSVRSSLGIGSFGCHRSIIFNENTYNLSQTGPKGGGISGQKNSRELISSREIKL